MAQAQNAAQSAATQQTRQIRDQLQQLANQAREDVRQANDPRARALLETTAEVLNGLRTAYEHFERGEAAWQ